MTWTQDDTKDVVKKVLGTIIAMALISFVSVLADVDVALLFAMLLIFLVSLLLFLAARRHLARGRLSSRGNGLTESSIAKKDELDSRADKELNLPSPRSYHDAQDTELKMQQPSPPAIAADVFEEQREKVEMRQNGRAAESEKELGSQGVDELVSLYEGLLEVEKQESLHFSLGKGDVVEGTLRETDGQSFDLYIMDERNYARFSASRDEKSAREFLDESSYFVRWIVPRSGEWYFVLDLYSKQYSRKIEIVLRRSRN